MEKTTTEGTENGEEMKNRQKERKVDRGKKKTTERKT